MKMIKPTLTRTISGKLMALLGSIFEPREDTPQLSPEQREALQREIHDRALSKCQKWMPGYPAIVEVSHEDAPHETDDTALRVTILPISDAPSLTDVAMREMSIVDTYLWNGESLEDFHPLQDWDLDQHARLIFK